MTSFSLFLLMPTPHQLLPLKRTHFLMYHQLISGVLQLLKELDPLKVSGPDEYHPNSYGKLHSPLSDTHISSFNTSGRSSLRLEEGICDSSVQEGSMHQSI